MTWKTGRREPRRYKTKEDSLKDCEKVWAKHYGGRPNRAMAVKWTGNDSPDTWLTAVNQYLNSL